MRKFALFILFICLLGSVCLAEGGMSFVLPVSTTVIGGSAFEGCSSITKVTIPTTTTVIEQGAFGRCTNLTDVYYHGTREEWANIEIQDDNGPLTSAVMHFCEPKMYLTTIPAYGEHKNVEGVVRMDDGSELDSSKYKVTVYIETTWGWYVKPTFSDPAVSLDDNGCFSLQYDTGGENDRTCGRIMVLLLPVECSPTSRDAWTTSASALDMIIITRTEDGTVTCDPERRLDDPYEYHNKRTSFTVSSDTIALDVGLFLNGEPAGATLSEETIRTRLQVLVPYCDVVRFYGAGGTTYGRAYTIAKELGFDVIGGAWLCGDESADQAELDALIDMCNSGKCDAACVGSEALLRGQLSVSEIVAYIDYVRERIPDSIPVTCADSIDIICNSTMLQSACDFYFVNSYPYWSGVSIDNAIGAFADSVSALQSCDTTKQIIISETGWPTSGSAKGNAVPGDENAAVYFKDMRKWSHDNNIVVCYFEAFDEKWKGSTDDDVERHWGLFGGDLALKSAFEDDEFFD